MSIVDAISKAKKIAQETQAQEALAQQSVANVAHREMAARDIAAPQLEPRRQPVKPIEPVHMDVDIVTCRKHRLLVAGSEEMLESKVESAYRMLRTRLLQRARAQGWTTIGVTSAQPADGKTLTSLNLALSLAKEKNNDIVLLDLDMRNPSVFKCLGASPEEDVLEYFEGTAQPEKLFVSIGVENLVIAGNTRASDRSSELLSSSKFEELIAYIKSATSRPLIIVDLPPVLSTDDALVLAPRVDAILVVTSEGKTARGELQRAVDTLAEFRIAGFVLNRSQDAVKGYGYY